MLNGYWLGQQRRDPELALAITSAAVPLAAALAAPQAHILAALAIAQAAPVLAAVSSSIGRPRASPDKDHDRALLRRYIFPGLVIGVLTPIATVAARGIVSTEMSWQEVGLLQALWRCFGLGGERGGRRDGVYFLPRLAAAHRTPQFAAELQARRPSSRSCRPQSPLPCPVLRGPVFALLYDESFLISDHGGRALFFGGQSRGASPLGLTGSTRSTRCGAPRPLSDRGFFFSCPIFAVLLAVQPRACDARSAERLVARLLPRLTACSISGGEKESVRS